MIEIDGSHGEGGGAILRNALALSAALGKPVRVFDIRKGRGEPGLKLQHLTAVRALQEVCGAEVKGAEKGAGEVSFSPGKIAGGKFRFDVGSAGSITLVLQALLPALAFAEKESEIEIIGGTHVNWSPPFEYFHAVLLPQLRRMGCEVGIELLRNGWYPKGGGAVRARVKPAGALRPIRLVERDGLVRIRGVSIASNLPEHVAKRQADAVKEVFPQAEIEVRNSAAASPGSAVVLWAEFSGGAILGASALGERGKPAEKVGKEAAEALGKEIAGGAAVDAHLADQLLVYMALAEGRSEILAHGLSGHARTNVWLIEQFIKRNFEIRESGEGNHTVAIEGAALGK